MKRFHNMNAHVVDWEDSFGMIHMSLISYKTLVCDIISTGKRNDDASVNIDVVFFQNWRYSPTTTRQVTRFITEMTGVNWTAKELDKCFNGLEYFGFTDYRINDCDIHYMFEKVNSPYGKKDACEIWSPYMR